MRPNRYVRRQSILSLETINSPPVVAIIDGDPDVLDGLNLTLSSFGYRPALFASAEEIPRRGGNI
jgi:hypothetical protein